MKVLLAVIEDLCIFAYRALSGSLPYTSSSTAQTVINTHKQLFHPAPSTPKLSESITTVSQKNRSSQEEAVTSVGALIAGYQYYIGVPKVYVYQDPVISFDGALRCLAYGQSVRLVALRGRWAQVRLAGRLGWVLKDVLAEDKNTVYPRFVDGELYDAEHPETGKLRMLIDDMFGGGRGAFPLMPPEYIQYRLQEKHRVIDWGDTRQRIAGTWQHKLRGRTGVHIGIHPKTISIMEYTIDDMGHLAFVEAVFPDSSIHITQIGKKEDSQYSDQMLTQEQWKELRPVFIDVL